MDQDINTNKEVSRKSHWRIYMVIGLALIALGLIATFTLASRKETPPKTDPPATVEADENCAVQTNKDEVTITHTDQSKFEPACVTISSGTKVTYKNESGQLIEIGADPHPSHSRDKHVTNEEFVLEVAPGESQSVTMTKKGTFGFHDHRRASTEAKIIVH